MSTLLALLVFIVIMAVLGAMLGWLSASNAALDVRRLFRTRKSDEAASATTSAPLVTDVDADGDVGVNVGANVGANVDEQADNLPLPAEQLPAEQLPAEQLIERVNACLPQTQCAQCGHPGCRPYATAIIADDAPINQCPPGGEALIHELADLLGKEFLPLDAERGETKPPQVALIDEPLCIGCTLCIAACPVDAIVGASKLMHTVISEQCTGCELCLPPCPVDCISLVPGDTSLAQWRWPKPA